MEHISQMKTNRRQSREVAFSILFEWSFRPEITIDSICQTSVEARELVIDTFAEEIIAAVVENTEEIDKIIMDYSKGWKINRLSKVVLSLLRMALCEILFFEDIPQSVTINEAVELVKIYGDDEDRVFLNGMLGNIVRDREEKDGKAEKDEK